MIIIDIIIIIIIIVIIDVIYFITIAIDYVRVFFIDILLMRESGRQPWRNDLMAKSKYCTFKCPLLFLIYVSNIWICVISYIHLDSGQMSTHPSVHLVWQKLGITLKLCVCVCVIISLCSGLFLCTVMQYIGFVGVLFSA